MQSVSSRIWTRVAVSNSYDDNDYTTGTSTGTLFSRVGSLKSLEVMSLTYTKPYQQGVEEE